MSGTATSVRVQAHTKDLILKYSKRFKISQDELILKAILSAEQHNFSNEIIVNELEDQAKKNMDRTMKVLNILNQTIVKSKSEIFTKIDENVKADKLEILEFVHLTVEEEIGKFAGQMFRGEVEFGNRFMRRFSMFWEEVKPIINSKIIAMKMK